jgi:MFS family permease
VSGPEFLRTRLTWLTYAQLAVFGYFLYGFGPSVPLKRDDLHVSSAVGGLHGSALALGSTLAGLSFALLSRRVGRTGTLRVGLLGLAAGTLLYCLVPALPVTLTGALICGLFGSYVVTGSVVVLSAAHGTAGPTAFSEANAAAAGAGCWRRWCWAPAPRSASGGSPACWSPRSPRSSSGWSPGARPGSRSRPARRRRRSPARTRPAGCRRRTGWPGRSRCSASESSSA